LFIVATYSHKHGREFIGERHSSELTEIYDVIESVQADRFKTKISKEKTMVGRELYSPIEMNKEFERLLLGRGWARARIAVKTSVPETW